MFYSSLVPNGGGYVEGREQENQMSYKRTESKMNLPENVYYDSDNGEFYSDLDSAAESLSAGETVVIGVYQLVGKKTLALVPTLSDAE